mgnify:FL=1
MIVGLLIGAVVTVVWALISSYLSDVRLLRHLDKLDRHGR